MAVFIKVHAILCLVALFCCSVQAQLSTSFYANTCPNVEQLVFNALAPPLRREPRMGASLIRLFFHDCFAQGCDASILLDEVKGVIASEKNAFGNMNSTRGYDVINLAKQEVEKSCKGVVSCADILALAAQISIRVLRGPKFSMPLGRLDSKNASIAQANQLPAPFFSLSQLNASFTLKGLNTQDLVALSGAHTVGSAVCSAFRSRIWGGDTNINTSFALQSRQTCPASGGDSQLTPLTTPNTNTFSNQYYKNLVAGKGLLHSDQELFTNGTSFTDNLVRKYSNDSAAFFKDFADSMIRLGNIGVLTGGNGEIRLNCSRVN